jgi:hypothetical protein
MEDLLFETQCPVKDFVPPKPAAPPRRFSSFKLLFKTGRSSLGVISDRMYSSYMGEMWLPRRKLFLASHPAIVNRVLVTESGRFPKSEMMRSMLSLLVGDGIFVSNGERWTLAAAHDGSRLRAGAHPCRRAAGVSAWTGVAGGKLSCARARPTWRRQVPPDGAPSA